MSTTATASAIASATTAAMTAVVTYNGGTPQAWTTTVPAMDPSSTFDPKPWKYADFYIGGRLHNIFELTTTPYLNLPAACTLQTCSLKLSYSHYFPSLVGNSFLAALFGTLLLAHLHFGLRKMTPGFMISMMIGCAVEVIGYAGRLLLRSNPFAQSAFLLQFVSISVGPAFILASIRMCSVRIAMVYSGLSARAQPLALLAVFTICDYFSLLLQCAGGAVAASAVDGSQLQARGVNTMLSGLVLQISGFTLFIALSVDYAWRCSRSQIQTRDILAPLVSPKKWRLFLLVLTIATVAIYLRCVYRIVAFYEGFNSRFAQKEAPLMVFEGGLVAIAALLLALVHPGSIFPEDLTWMGFLASESSYSIKYPNVVSMWKYEKAKGDIRVAIQERSGAGDQDKERVGAPSATEFPIEAMEATVRSQQPGTPRFSFYRLTLPEELLQNWV